MSNSTHTSIDTTPAIEEDIRTATEAVLSGRPIPPDVRQRSEERSADFRRRMFEQHGLQDMGVSLIRQARETES